MTQREPFRQEAESGRAALAGWLKSAAIPAVIDQFKDRAEQSVAPLSRILYDQVNAYRLLLVKVAALVAGS